MLAFAPIQGSSGECRVILLYSIMITEPNGIVVPIHEKAMPVMFTTAAEIQQWLEAPMAETLQLQKPHPMKGCAST